MNEKEIEELYPTEKRIKGFLNDIALLSNKLEKERGDLFVNLRIVLHGAGRGDLKKASPSVETSPPVET